MVKVMDVSSKIGYKDCDFHLAQLFHAHLMALMKQPAMV